MEKSIGLNTASDRAKVAYESLEGKIAQYVEGPFDDLPLALHECVTKAFFPMRWKDLAPLQRLSLARQHDMHNDPANDTEQTYWFLMADEIGKTENRIYEWERKDDGGLVRDAHAKEEKLERLRDRLRNLRTLNDGPTFVIDSFENLSDSKLAGLAEKVFPPGSGLLQRDLGAVAPGRTEEQDAATCSAPTTPSQGTTDALEGQQRQEQNGPKFSMTRAGLIAAHEHEWPTIRRDIADASTNGLAAAKAAARDWNETAALAWARSKGKLTSAEKTSDTLAQSMTRMVSIPR